MSHSSSTKLPWWSSCRPLWGHKNIGVDISGVLVAPTLEIGQRIYQNLWRLCSLQSGSPSSIQPSTPTSNSQLTLGFSLHVLYHRPCLGWWPWQIVSGHWSVFEDAHFVACSKTISGEDTTELSLKNVVWLHDFPEDFTFDQGPQLMAKPKKSTRCSNNTSGVQLATNKTICLQ